MTAYQTLLALRLFEIVVISGAFAWLVWCFPPSRLRNIRLALAVLIITINLAAIIVAVAWAKISLW